MFVEENSVYRRFTRHWHVLGAIAILWIGYFATKYEDKGASPPLFAACFYSTEAFLLCWGIDTGMKVWVSFIAGPMMYKHLDRHSFSKIQAKLFPIYFFLSASLSFVQLAIFFQTKGTVSLNKSDKLAAASIATSLASGVLNGLWFTPKLNDIMEKRMAMEKEEGVVYPNIGSKLGENALYMQLKKDFGKYHGISTLMNLGGFAASVFMMYYISLEILSGSRALQMQ